MRKKQNLRKKLLIILIAVIAAFAVCVSVLAWYFHKQKTETEALNAALQAEMDENQKTIYVAVNDIEKGTRIDDTNVMQQKIYSGIEGGLYFTKDHFGEQAVVDIKAGQPVMADMTTPVNIQADTRKVEIGAANLMVTQKNNDIIDLRIMFPDGTDYLVLAKKQVGDLSLGSSLFTTNLGEDEILRLASAMVDAYTTEGTKIYTVNYVESNLQDAGIPNYPVRAAVLDLINRDPNIIDKAEETLNLAARQDLEERMMNMTDDEKKAVASGQAQSLSSNQDMVQQTERDEQLPDDGYVDGTDMAEDTVPAGEDAAAGEDAGTLPDADTVADSLDQISQ